MGNLKSNKTNEEWDMLVEMAKARLADQVDTLNGDSDSKITRLEVINHGDNEHLVGRLLTLYQKLGDFNNIELSYQDGGKMSWTDINQETQEPYYYDFNEWFEQFKKK